MNKKLASYSLEDLELLYQEFQGLEAAAEGFAGMDAASSRDEIVREIEARTEHPTSCACDLCVCHMYERKP